MNTDYIALAKAFLVKQRLCVPCFTETIGAFLSPNFDAGTDKYL